MSSFQTLPRIQRPTGALAVVAQASRTRPTPPPRGMTLSNQYTAKRTQRVPMDAAAAHLAALQRGYLSARTVMAAETALEVQMMLVSENRELFHAAAGVAAPDLSLPPRPVAVTLLAFGSQDHCRSARASLDALAHLAGLPLSPSHDLSPLAASLIRMSIFAGVDAEWFMEQTAAEALDSAPVRPISPGEVIVCARWANPHARGNIRSEFHTLATGHSLDQSLQNMQNCFLSMKISYMAPFPAAIAHSHPNVQADAWASALHTASDAFFELSEGIPCVHKAHALRGHEHQVNIESMGVVARICPRVAQVSSPTGEVTWTPLSVKQAVERADAFHALVIGNSSCKSEITTFAKMNEAEGLPPPDEDTARYCMHTCAVQANAFELREKVSLYATHHRVGGRLPGTPICSPGSWIWRFEPAIVALETVLPSFYVVPCTNESAFPGDRKLDVAFNKFFSRAFSLYAATFGNARLGAKEPLPFERMPLKLPEMTEDDDPSLRAAEEYALTAFSLPFSSQRVSIGDAYATLAAHRAPSQLTELLLQASLHLGINSSVLDAMGSAAQALKQMANTSPEAFSAQRDEVARLERVTDAAVDSASTRARELRPADVPISKVKQVLTALGLRKNECAMMPLVAAPADDYIEVVSTIAEGVLSEAPNKETHGHACRAAKRARRNGEMASMSAAITVLRGSARALPATAFVLGQAQDSSIVSCNRIGFNGAFETATMGHVVDAPERAVLLLHSGKKGIKVTSTRSA